MRSFSSLVPSYASQVLLRLCDNSAAAFGADNERELTSWLFVSNVHARFKNSGGRFLARWPSSDTLNLLKKNSGEHTNFDDDVIGITRRRHGSDMRVINFAKVMRISEHRFQPTFWKELAISASNLMMRVINDVEALFATFFAGDPHWDGSCEALPVSIDATDMDRATLRMLETYPWASKSTRPSGRVAFANVAAGEQTSIPAEGWDSGAHWGKKRRLFPHLWCRLATSPEVAREDNLIEDALNRNYTYEVSVTQACETVVTELRAPEPGEIITWDIDKQVYVVHRDLEHVGFLHCDDDTCFGAVPEEGLEAAMRLADESEAAALDEGLAYASHAKRVTVKLGDVRKEALRKGYRVASKVIESRPECERVRVPAPVARLFPDLLKRAGKAAAKLERILLEINSCLGEIHSRPQIMEDIERVLGEQKEAGGCRSFSRDETTRYVQQLAKDAVRVVRRELLDMGAEDPRKSPLYLPGELPLDKDEEALIKGIDYMPTVEGLVTDFAQAFGISIGGGGNSDSPSRAHVGERVAFRSDRNTQGTIEGFGALEAGHVGVDVIFDGSSEPKLVDLQSLLMAHTSWLNPGPPVLTGRFWQYASGMNRRLQTDPEPLSRIKKEPPRLRPPVAFNSAFSVTVQLARNGFCNPNAGILMVTRVSSVSWQTWSQKSSTEVCWIGRVRPGDFFVQMMRCVGNLGGRDGDFGTYVDWRVRYNGLLIKGEFLKEGGGQGIIYDLLKKPMEEALVMAGGVVAGIGAGVVFEKLYPKVADSKMLSGIMTAGAAATPLLGAVAVTVAETTQKTFTAVCTKFLDSLADHGVVKAPGADPLAPNEETSWQSELVLWGAIIHREKAVQLTAGPQGLALNEDGSPKTYHKYQRYMSVHVENFNYLQAPTISFGPGSSGLEFYAKLDFTWDLTHWVERRMNAKLFAENQERIEACTACLRKRFAFCDWRVPLETLWTKEYDVCVNDTAEEQEYCSQENGVVDSVGHPVTATFYSISDSKDGMAACQGIPFPRANREFRLNDNLRRYFRRH